MDAMIRQSETMTSGDLTNIETTINVNSSAPHIRPASSFKEGKDDWGMQPEAISGSSQSTGKLLWKDGKGAECGVWDCTPGRWRLSLPADELCHFVAGKATYRSDDGEVIEISPGTVVHFKEGWAGECEVHETMRNVYMLITSYKST